MSSLDARLAALSPEQRALFEARLRQKGLTAPRPKTIQPIPGRERLEYFPSSLDQERLWFIDQMEPGNTAYNIHTASRLFGPLDPEVMRRAVNASIARHEVLRTTFRVADGLPVQVVAPSLEIDVPVIDLQGVPNPEREAAAQRAAVEAAAVQFDLARGPLVRVSLARLGPEDHILMINMHHAVTDRWSFDVFEREVSQTYVALRDGAEVRLPPLPIQFADFAAWQREELSGERLERHLAYWREKLAGAPLALEIPTDRPRPPVQSFAGAREYVIYPEALLAALKEMTHRAGGTMFMTMLAALDVLCWKYTSRRDLIIGSAIAHRDRPETEEVIGYFLNMLLLRARIDPAMSFNELLTQARETALGAFAHQEVPFATLLAELKPRPDPSRNPLIQISLIYLDFPDQDAPGYAGLSCAPMDVDNGASRVDMTLACSDLPGMGLHTYFEYSSALYNPPKVRRMLRHLRRILEVVAGNPEVRLSDIDLLDEEERALVLGAWSSPSEGPEPDRLLHRSIGAIAARTPDAPAVVCGGESLTFGALEARSSRIAHRLRGAGIGREAPVGLFLDRSVEAVAGILGILKAGGAYVPLDPTSPPGRTAGILQDAGVRLLLTRASLRKLLPDDVFAIELDADDEISAESDQAPTDGTLPDNLAYIIYTSGSTGRPKGVLVSHGNLAHSILARRDFYGDGPRGLLLLSSFCFDSSVAGLFWTLSQGGTLVLPEEGMHQDPAYLARLIARHRPTHLVAVPSQVGLLLEEAGEDSLRSLTTVIVGGESCPPELARRHHETLSGAALFNEYGPTEATVWSTAGACAPPVDDTPVPIGRPIPGTRVYLLDDCLHPVPAGVSGEIFIGGGGVTRGYLGRPDLTAAQFVPDPFPGRAGERLYRTGDLARFREDGTIQFLGRADTQIKIRGVRVEPSEIERALTRIPGVAEAVVVARGEAVARRLVAYIVADGAVPEEDRMRSELRRSLPATLIPSAFVLLDRLPLGPGGKVDRSALPEPPVPAAPASLVAPRNETERVIAGIWGEMLRRDVVGVEENFFEIGGDSLLATRVVSRVRSAFDVELPLRRFFEDSTVAALASAVGELLVLKLESMSDEEAAGLLERHPILPAG